MLDLDDDEDREDCLVMNGLANIRKVKTCRTRGAKVKDIYFYLSLEFRIVLLTV